jgi:hypothetical protein
VQEPLWQSGLGCWQVAWFVQPPALLHVWGVSPLHWLCPGAHVPEHRPA